jgi:hypothetical protein
MPTVITAERPDTREAMELIAELDAYLAPLYPPESRHGLRRAETDSNKSNKLCPASRSAANSIG